MKDFIALLKLPPSILSALSLGSGLVLFLPNWILIKLGLNNMLPIWRTIIGIIFIITSCLLAIYVLIKLFKILARFIELFFTKISISKTINALSDEELKILIMLYRTPNFSSNLPLSDGITSRLINKKLIQFASKETLAKGNRMFIIFTITSIAQDYLNKHPEILKKCNKDDLQKLYNQMNEPLNHIL